MTPIELSITNFKSFTTTQVFHFGDTPGLYFLTGRNDAEPRLGANGVGKSTIWDAFCWLRFGKTVREVKAGDAANWETGKNCSVTLRYSHDDLEYVCTRTWNPNTWDLTIPGGDIIDLSKDETNLFVSHFGLEFEPFLNCILFAQHPNPQFLDLKAVDKAALFSQVMGLDRWLELSTKASNQASLEDRKVRELENTLQRMNGTVDAWNTTNFDASIAEWETDRDIRIQALQKDIPEREITIRENNVAIKKAEDQIVLVETKYREVAKIGRGIQDQISEHDKSTRDTILVPRGVLEAELKHVTKQLNAGQQKNCPTCGQAIAASASKQQMEVLADREEVIVKQIKDFAAALATSGIRSTDLTKQLRAAENNVQELKSQKTDAESKIRDLKHGIELANTNIQSITYQCQAILSTSNPFVEQRDKLKAVAEELALDITRTQQELEILRNRYACFSYWVRGFKELRLFMIAETLEQLEIEVNSALTELGLEKWELRFDVDRETKSGTIQKGFNVKVVSPANVKQTPWESWSGGESQRLRLAASMGLANLIRNSRGITMDIEVWDEPTDALSEQGVFDLMESLTERARNEKRRIWIIDHRSLGFGEFTGTRTVVKDQESSYIK